jgi:alpha-D-ribose 1-methylphosphonate 5-triphosphate synthase subunit PhnG
MGGPYVSLAVLDVANQRVIVGYGYVYAPNKDKRNFIRQIEAMLYSMKLNNQEQNDNMNMEVEVRPDA